MLRSPVLLEPVASSFGLSPGALGARISIATSGGLRGGAQGVLNASFTERDPQEDQTLLQALSETYLQAVLKEHQQRLASGLAFLNKQAPALKARTSAVQAEVASFDKLHQPIEPTKEGVAVTNRLAEA